MENFVCANCGRTEPSAGSCPDCGSDMIAQSMLGGDDLGLGHSDDLGDDDTDSLEELRADELEDEDDEEEGDDDL